MSRMTARQARGAPVGRAALYVAFAGVSVAFVLSTAISEYADVRIQRAAAQITTTTAPGVESLATLRGELRWYVLLADDATEGGVDGRPRPPAPELGHARVAIARAWDGYRALLLPREERALAAETSRIKMQLDAVIGRLEGQMARAAWSQAASHDRHRPASHDGPASTRS